MKVTYEDAIISSLVSFRDETHSKTSFATENILFKSKDSKKNMTKGKRCPCC